jgi:hypothetical protein
MAEVHEIRVTAARLPEHVCDRCDLAEELEMVLEGAGGGQWVAGGCWFPLGQADPADPNAHGWEMMFEVADPDRAVAAVVRRLTELGASPETVVEQSGAAPRRHRVYSTDDPRDAEQGAGAT